MIEQAEQLPDSVLIVEDTPGLSLLLRTLLETEGVNPENIKSTASVEGAMELLEKTEFGLALINLRLQQGTQWRDGTEILEWWRDRRERDGSGLSSMRIFVVTAEQDETVAKYCRRLGAEEVVFKPFDIQELMTRIKRRRTDVNPS